MRGMIQPLGSLHFYPSLKKIDVNTWWSLNEPRAKQIVLSGGLAVLMEDLKDMPFI